MRVIRIIEVIMTVIVVRVFWIISVVIGFMVLRVIRDSYPR